MKTCLLDVNVLLALAWPHHTHHNTVHQWWRKAGLTRWASCLLTQLGFVRLSCHPRFAPTPATPSHAAQVLARMISRTDHQFWNEIPGALADPDLFNTIAAGTAHGQVTDACLAALARHHHGNLATLDRSLAARHQEMVRLVQ